MRPVTIIVLVLAVAGVGVAAVVLRKRSPLRPAPAGAPVLSDGGGSVDLAAVAAPYLRKAGKAAQQFGKNVSKAAKKASKNVKKAAKKAAKAAEKEAKKQVNLAINPVAQTKHAVKKVKQVKKWLGW